MISGGIISLAAIQSQRMSNLSRSGGRPQRVKRFDAPDQ